MDGASCAVSDGVQGGISDLDTVRLLFHLDTYPEALVLGATRTTTQLQRRRRELLRVPDPGLLPAQINPKVPPQPAIS